jgi:hypothetical protein
MIKGQDAVIIAHNAIFGDHRRPVGEFHVSDVKPFAQYDRSVYICWRSPTARTRWTAIAVVPNDMLFYTIERYGDVLYDSRSDIPCDMDVFAEKKAEWETRGQAHRRSSTRASI